MRIVHLADAHVSREPSPRLPGVDLKARAAAAVSAAQALEPPPELYVLGGDMLDDGPLSDYQVLSELFGPTGRPVYICLGNHDSLEAYSRAPLPGAAPAAPGYCSFDVQDRHIVILFTAADGRDQGSLDGPQLRWLRDDLLASAPARCRIFMHHPPVELGVPWVDAMGLEDPDAFWEVLQPCASRVAGVFFAHAHFAVSLARHGVLVASPPAVGWQFCADPNALRAETTDELPGFNVVDVWDRGLTVRTVRFTPPQAGPPEGPG